MINQFKKELWTYCCVGYKTANSRAVDVQYGHVFSLDHDAAANSAHKSFLRTYGYAPGKVEVRMVDAFELGPFYIRGVDNSLAEH